MGEPAAPPPPAAAPARGRVRQLGGVDVTGAAGGSGVRHDCFPSRAIAARKKRGVQRGRSVQAA